MPAAPASLGFGGSKVPLPSCSAQLVHKDLDDGLTLSTSINVSPTERWVSAAINANMVEEVGTPSTRQRGTQEFLSAPASFRLKLRPFTSVSLRMVFPPAGG